MGKYVYLSFISWLPGGDQDKFNKQVVPKLHNDKVELLHHGFSYGTIEDYVMVHRTDLDIEAYTNFRGEACTIDGKNWIDHARTVTSVPWK